MSFKLSKVDTSKGHFIVIFSNGKINGEMQFVHVLLGDGKRVLIYEARKKVQKIMLQKNNALTHMNSIVDWMDEKDTELLRSNRLKGTNQRFWFLVDRSGVHELQIK